MPWQKSFQQRFRWKRWCRLRAAPELFPWPGHTTGICFFVPFLMAVTVLDVASHSATSGMGGGQPAHHGARCATSCAHCHAGTCTRPQTLTQLLLLVQASLKTRRHPYLSAATLQVPTLLLPCPRGGHSALLKPCKGTQNMQHVSPLSPAGHVTTSRTLFFPNSCDKLYFLPLHASTHMLCHSRAICCCCSAGAGRGSSQLLAQPRTLETRKPFPHVLRLGEGPSPKACGAGPSTGSRLIYKGAHTGVTSSLQNVTAVGQGGEAEELSSAPSGLGHLLPITSLLAAHLFTIPQLSFLSTMLCVFSFLSPPHVLPLSP